MSLRNRKAAANIAAITRSQPGPSKGLPETITLRTGDAGFLAVLLRDKQTLEKQLVEVNAKINQVVADVAKDAGVSAQDLTTRYTFTGASFEKPPTQEQPKEDTAKAE